MNSPRSGWLATATLLFSNSACSQAIFVSLPRWFEPLLIFVTGDKFGYA